MVVREIGAEPGPSPHRRQSGFRDPIGVSVGRFSKSAHYLSAGLTAIEKESNVTKRVPFGEPFSVANFSATRGFTEDAESESSRRRAFYALSGKATYDDTPPRESSQFLARERRLQALSASTHARLSRSPFNRGIWGYSPVPFGPRREPFAKWGHDMLTGTAASI